MNNPLLCILASVWCWYSFFLFLGVLVVLRNTINYVFEKNTFWLHVGTVSLDLLFVAVVIIIRHKSLPQRTLTLCLMVKLKCLCSAQREIIWPSLTLNVCKKEEINISLSWCWSFLETFCRADGPYYFTSLLPLPLYSAFYPVPPHLSLVL